MKKLIATLLGLTILIPQAFAVTSTTAATTTTATTSAATTTSFKDVAESHDNYVAIKYLKDNNIIKGYADGTFKPDASVNRAEALKFILEANKTTLPATADNSGFKDVKADDWYTKYLAKAKELGIVNGNADGTFSASRQVAKSEFIKMLLSSHGFKTDKWAGQQIFNDVPKDAWYNPYMNYAGQAGLVLKDSNNNLNPTKTLTRGQVAEIIYLMEIILKGKDTQFLLNQAESQMAQIERFISSKKVTMAKRASELSVDITQQAYKNLPDNKVVLGAAKLAKAYDFLVSAYQYGTAGKTAEANQYAQQAIDKATEAWNANNEIQPIAKHIKDGANEIISGLKAKTTTK